MCVRTKTLQKNHSRSVSHLEYWCMQRTGNYCHHSFGDIVLHLRLMVKFRRMTKNEPKSRASLICWISLSPGPLNNHSRPRFSSQFVRATVKERIVRNLHSSVKKGTLTTIRINARIRTINIKLDLPSLTY